MKSIINRQTPPLMENNYKYFAFISYNAKDTEWGKKLQKKLEHYKLPATLCSEHGWERCPIKPVFFAPTDIQPGGLSEELPLVNDTLHMPCCGYEMIELR